MQAVDCKALEQLLSATSREQHINGKAQKQVSSCVLLLENNRLSTTCIVKDGKTSLARFSFATSGGAEGREWIPVPDIERLLGVLKYHSGNVTMTYINDTDSVRIKSSNKQTTLVGGWKAKSHGNLDVKEWDAEARKRAEQIKNNVYKLKDGSTRSPFTSISVSCDALYDALRCDGMNGQKLNRYTFSMADSDFSVSVGDAFKGMTTTGLGDSVGDDFTATFEGGLEHVLRHYSGNATLSFLDFTKEGQGIRLIMTFDNGDWVFQAGVL